MNIAKTAGCLMVLVMGMGAPVAARNVTVDQTLTQSTEGTTASSFTFEGFHMGRSTALVVVINSESLDGRGTPEYTVTLGGRPLTGNAGRVFENEGAQGSAIYWTLNPVVRNGDLVVELDGRTSAAAVSVMTLRNVFDVGDTATATATENRTLRLSYRARSGGLVVVNGIDNRFGLTGGPILQGDHVDVELQRHPWDFGDGSTAGLAQGYGQVTGDGEFTETYNPNRGSSDRNAATLVVLNPRP